MRRTLGFKLVLGFLFVALIGSIVLGVAIRHRTRRDFSEYVLNASQARSFNQLMDYYRVNGTWEGIDRALGSSASSPMPGPPFQPRGRNRLPFQLIDADGTIVHGHAEMMGMHMGVDRDSAIPLDLDGQTVGWIVPYQPGTPWPSGTPEDLFVINLNRGIVLSGGFAILVALIMGILIAQAITQPIRELRTGTQAIAAGELGYQVQVYADDELGQLSGRVQQDEC